MIDEIVLEAQEWVNSTYGDVSGYVRCAEDGRTGWNTMYSLTRALQHELGITALSNAFGPTTMARLEAHGPIGSDEANTNIIKIIQSACFCKGYNAGGINGRWGNKSLGVSTDYAIDFLMRNMGLGDFRDGRLHAKVFKALLTMDAYVIVSGGDTEIRKIQQWINQNYWQKSFHNIIPCEGHYSRSVQQALMKALQSAFGIPDAQVTGNFGPATRDGLTANQLIEGDSGLFVQFLSAACVFNGRVLSVADDDELPVFYQTVFKEHFDTPLGTYIEHFQRFNLLEINRQADFRTWCQLLVSMGDPERDAQACDTRFTITPARGALLAELGLLVVGRYLDEEATGTLDKEIKEGELDVIFDAGLKVFPIWQYNARLLSDFTWASGYDHGTRAHERMIHYGFNPGAIVYFAVDYDATDANITSNIIPYFNGVQAALGALGRKYRTGVYGSRNVCIRASEEALAVSSFVSGMSWGFSGNLGFPLPVNWSFNQIQEVQHVVDGQTVDIDRNVHRTDIDPGIGRDGVGGGAVSSLEELLQFVDDVHTEAVSYGGDVNVRVLEYLRSPGYTKNYAGWDFLLGRWDQDWIDHAEAIFEERRLSFLRFRDPTYGAQIFVDHLAATANAVYLEGAGSASEVTRGDFGGWGGDLSTFYADWRNNSLSYASGYAFCMDRLARRDVLSTYGFNDMVEDADGYHMGLACRDGAFFKDAFREHLTGTGHATRFSRFFSGRFGGSVTTAAEAARTMLSDVGDDSTLNTLRDAAIMMTASPLVIMPKDLSEDRFNPFLQGFAESIQRLASLG